MSHGGDRTGERLGPYQLDRRYEDIDEPGGHLYAAHHVDTGCPALVLVPVPGERWGPRSDFSAHLTAQSDPPFVATHLERPPPPEAQALTDVDLAFIRMAGGIASVEDRQEANADFTRAPPTGWSPPQAASPQAASRWLSVRTVALVAAVLGLGTLVLWPRLPPGSSRQGVEAPVTASVAPAAWLDPTGNTSVIGYPMPETAYPGQAKPPCPKGYEELRSGCWLQAKQEAPCPQNTAEHEGKCYMPLRETKPVPRSLGR